ncbi:MAG: four helix bundle protein [Algibacter sp.]|uniref:four helix bundle protein n=1 Tax=Algibacter sp. TaxID=1872428 RepID=UPI002604ED21|nr:four helix bundle protein [Algibacter sp.]MDG1729653.1 four helix bundle protein [Algibacter sp.]MDG2179529.1 four helix bundle protein [Algibacter sp.]
MRDFRTLEIWKNGIELVKQVYQISNKFPSEEKFGLKSQIIRAAVSIPSNIAKGCSRNSEVEFKRFLEIAIGSLFEVETQLIIAQELKFIKTKKLENIFSLIEKEAKMINSLINKIKNS